MLQLLERNSMEYKSQTGECQNETRAKRRLVPLGSGIHCSKGLRLFAARAFGQLQAPDFAE